MTIGFAVGSLALAGSLVLNYVQSLWITDLKSGAFAELAAHVATPEDALQAGDAQRQAIVDKAEPEPVRLPRASVRDPLPPATLVGDLETDDKLHKPLHKSRLTKVGRLKMQASHPRYSAATHERARAELDAMGLTPKGNPKRKHK